MTSCLFLMTWQMTCSLSGSCGFTGRLIQLRSILPTQFHDELQISSMNKERDADTFGVRRMTLDETCARYASVFAESQRIALLNGFDKRDFDVCHQWFSNSTVKNSRSTAWNCKDCRAYYYIIICSWCIGVYIGFDYWCLNTALAFVFSSW